ncbi:MAG: mechanosensitive ion channel family protein, partial [Spirochaetales bacterium]|nr:mechanosensitive ion channel family protein [Spirochaetales bacterium]
HVDGSFVIVMRPQQSLTFVNYLPVLFSMLMALLFMAGLTVATCIGDECLPPGPAADETPKEDVETEASDKSHSDDMIAMLDNLFQKKKPYFEERWPRDLRKWKDCNPEERFAKIAKAIIIFAMASIVILAIIAGEHSVWYYCLSGNWGTGINLYSATSCIISICILSIIKMLVHKLMFLIARTAGARGETICHLTDSFSGYVLVIIGVFICLYKLGVNMTALSLTGGVAGVVFGIGCQNIVADILSGIIMAFDGSVHVGDLVSYNGQFGVVLSIGVRTTTLKWFGDITVIRNNDFKNFIRRPADEQARVITNLKVDQHESLERIKEILDKELPVIHEKLCVAAESEIIGPTFRGVESIDESGMTLGFSILCKAILAGLIPRDLNMELKLMCERNGIKLSSYQVMLSSVDKDEKKA